MNKFQSGSALIYVLVAIAVLGIITATLSDSGGQGTQQQQQTKLISELSGQIDFITSAIQECVLNYPNQDTGLTSADQKNQPYPINPASGYFGSQSAVPAASADNKAKFIRCPGNPGGAGSNNQNHALIFGSASGKFFPQPPAPMGEWHYFTGDEGVAIYINSNKSDPYILTALQKLEAKYTICEADLINATSGAVDIFSGGLKCPAGNRCFRYWIIRKPTAIPAESGCT